MTNPFFISLPVRDLKKSMAFYAALGGVNNPQFTDETAACMVFSESLSVMLVTHTRWAGFTKKPIAPPTSSEVSFCPPVASRAEVDRMVEAAAALGGKADVNPPEDHGFMYQRTVEDPDGHIWEPTWLDMSQMPKK